MRINAFTTVFLLFVPLAFAAPFSQVASYAEQFENGQLSYLQLSVLLFSEKEKLFDELNSKSVDYEFGEERSRGWDEATMHSLFGEPTGLEQWAWSPNLRKSIRLEKPVPTWAKEVYKGSKVKINFESWPHLIKRETGDILFYDFDLHTRFEHGEQVDAKSALAEMKQLFQAAVGNEANARQAALKAVQFEQVLSDYLRNNENSCRDILKEWFGQEGGETSKLRWGAVVYTGEKLVVNLRGEEWTDSNWHGFNSWMDIERHFDYQGSSTQDKRYDFQYSTAGEYFSRIREVLHEVKRTAANVDSSDNRVNMDHLEELNNEYSALVNSLSERTGRQELDLAQDQIIIEFEKIFSAERDFVKENYKQLEFKQRLVNITEQVTSSYCTSTENSCGDLQACANAQCINARGGNEQCDDKSDNDGDYLVDCDDVDCFEVVSCGKKCQPICGGEGACWECGGQECNRECDACGQCNDNNPNNPEACSKICDACGQCTDAKCSIKCEICWECEDEYYGGGCRSECKSCNECNENNKDGAKDCSAECLQCNKCDYEKGNTKCDAPQVLNPSTYTCDCPGCQVCNECYNSDAVNCEENPACVSCNKCGYDLGWRTCEPPHVLDQRTYSCNCPDAADCPDNQYQDGETCKCVASEQPTSEVPVQSTPIAEAVQQIQTTNSTLVSQAVFPKISALPFSSITGLFSEAPLEGESCGGACSANQFCNATGGWCECQQGFFDCDGDWQNGCESEVQCQPCKADSDCAPQRCSEDHLRFVEFKCTQGDSWTNEKASAEAGAFCAVRNSGERESGIWFSAWGDDFQNFDQFKQQAWSQGDRAHCENELEQLRKERIELQSSLNDEFFAWFFDRVVSRGPEDFEDQFEFIGGIYASFMRNTEDTARALRCLGRTDWPSEYQPINAEIKTEFGKIHIWEEKKRTSFWGVEQEVLSPYMKIWVFPPKEVFKEFFPEKIKEEGPKGPTPEELAEMRNSPWAMERIRRIANAFGGDARLMMQFVDEGKPLAKFLFTINERDLIDVREASEYQGNVSATISISLDFIYDVASSMAKEMEGEHVQYPYWEEHEQPIRLVDDSLVGMKIFTRILQGLVSGEVKIEPASALPNVIFIFTEMMTMMMQAP